MRSILLSSSRLSSLAGAFVLATSGVLAACSSAPSTGGESSPVLHPNEPSSSGGNASSSTGGNSDNGSSSGGSGSSSSGSSSGSATSSSGSGGTTPAANTITADTTWADGQMISASTGIAAGVTVTVANGATVTFAAGTSLTISGTLTATNATTHAKFTGTGWTGLIIPAGGTLNANSLDITGASTALDVLGTAEYDYGTITSGTAFNVGATGALTTKNSTVATPTSESSITGGTFTASYLDYDADTVGAFILNGGTASISDSTFHSTATDESPDMISSEGPGSLTMLYTAISGRHCSFHFDAITSFDLENLNVSASDYGFMMYGSSATSGTRVLKNSNFANDQYGIAEDGTNGAITVTGTYFSSTAKISLSDQEVTISNAATSATANTVGPRAQ